MVTVKFLQDYGSYKKGQAHKVNSAETLQTLSRKGIIEIVKATPETAVMPKAETAVIKAPEVHTRTTKTAKKKK